MEKNGQKWLRGVQSRCFSGVTEREVFRGSTTATVDEKGRLKVPTDFRRGLEERHGSELFMTSVTGEQVLLYPLPVWMEIEKRLLALPATDRLKERYLERVAFYGSEAKLDPQGRVLVPAILRIAAGMQGEVVVSGRLDHLVVWNRERLERRLAEQPFSEADFAALAERGI